jgi:hypothetical protein
MINLITERFMLKIMARIISLLLLLKCDLLDRGRGVRRELGLKRR